MNDRRTQSLFIILCTLFVLNAFSCKSVPPVDTSHTDKQFIEVVKAQTEVITTGKDVESTIGDIKTITDDAKVSGEIPKEKVITLIKYVDQSAEQIKQHNEKVKELNKEIITLEESRINDNKEHAIKIDSLETTIKKLEPYKHRFIVACLILAFIGILIAGYVFLKVKKLLFF